VSERYGDQPVKILLMNEYGGGMPLWDDGCQTDGDELGLSDELRADLQAFSTRWESSISPDVFDDRWDGNWLMSRVTSAKYTLKRLINPGAGRAAVAEDAAMRRIGEALRDRLQAELGDGYVVTFRHY